MTDEDWIVADAAATADQLGLKERAMTDQQQTEKPSRILYFQKHKDCHGDVCVIFAAHLGHEDEKTAAGIYGAMDVLSRGKFGLTPLWESVRVEMPGPFPHVPFNVGPWSAAIIAGPTWDASEAAKATSHV